jgi:hypothetical protein
LCKWCKVKMIDFNAEVRCYVITDHFKPAALLLGERLWIPAIA